VSFLEFDSLRDRAEHVKKYGTAWSCTRHDKPNEVLSTANPVTERVLIASTSPYESVHGTRTLPDLFWFGAGPLTGSGLCTGPGFKAFASDFPEGTRLIITARIEPPNGGEES
jgi:hypothetical protein